MNPDDVILAVSLSQTKAEVIDRLRLSHTTRNFRLLSECIKRHGINTSHLQGIKVTTYLEAYGLTTVEETN